MDVRMESEGPRGGNPRKSKRRRPDGPPVLLRHRDCGQPVRLQLACEAGHVLDSARDVAPVPGPGARKIA